MLEDRRTSPPTAQLNQQKEDVDGPPSRRSKFTPTISFQHKDSDRLSFAARQRCAWDFVRRSEGHRRRGEYQLAAWMNDTLLS